MSGEAEGQNSDPGTISRTIESMSRTCEFPRKLLSASALQFFAAQALFAPAQKAIKVCSHGTAT